MKNLFFAALFAMILGFCPCIASEPGNDQKFSESITEFERAFAHRQLILAGRNGINDDIQLLGFQSADFPEEYRDQMLQMKEMMSMMPDTVKVGLWIADDGSSMRTYFPLPESAVDYAGKLYFADEDGFLSIPDIEPEDIDMSKITMRGRKRTDKIRGTGSNIITDDVIFYSKEFEFASTYRDINAIFYDLGEINAGGM